MKTILIRYIISPKELDIRRLKETSYDTIYLLYTRGVIESDSNILATKIEHLSKAEIKSKILEKGGGVIEEHINDNIVVMVDSDYYTDIAVELKNKANNTSFDHKFVVEKNAMSEFLGEALTGKKTFIKKSELLASDYSKIVDKVGQKFILKPVDGYSSVSTFAVNNKEEFKRYLELKSAEFDYLCERYLGGELYSFDFYAKDGLIYIVSYDKETPMIEYFDDKYLVENNLEEFKFFLPIRYNTTPDLFNKQFLLDYFDQLASKINSVGYSGYFHMELKIDFQEQRIGFIEWGGRLGAKRSVLAKHHYDINVEEVPIISSESSLFERLSNSVYLPKKRATEKTIGLKITCREDISVDNLKKNKDDVISDIIKNTKSKYGITTLEELIYIYKICNDTTIKPFYADQKQAIMPFFTVSLSDFAKIQSDFPNFVLENCLLN